MQKKGFILVSHDRDLRDACVDHVLVLNRATIEVQVGNFSSWWENKIKKDHFSEMENEKHRKEITKLEKAADRISAYLKCIEEEKMGNRDFAQAKVTILEGLIASPLPEVRDFMREFIPSFILSTDELSTL